MIWRDWDTIPLFQPLGGAASNPFKTVWRAPAQDWFTRVCEEGKVEKSQPLARRDMYEFDLPKNYPALWYGRRTGWEPI